MQSIQIGNRKVAQLVQGTWNMGDSPMKRAVEVAALRHGLELGLSVIDTAEMYGDGRSEQLVREAIADMRDQTYLVSKVLPSNASTQGTVSACEASLKRLRVETLDLYLLHWPGRFPLEETAEALTACSTRARYRRGVCQTSMSQACGKFGHCSPGLLVGRSGSLQPRVPRDRVRPSALV